MPTILVTQPLIVPRLLPAGECGRLLGLARSAPVSRSVYLSTEKSERDPGSRQSDEVALSGEALSGLRSAIADQLPRVRRHFAEPELAVVGPARVLRYREGDFIMQHRDHGEVTQHGRTVRRVVSFSVLLSAPADFTGGDLVGYGVHHIPGFERLGKTLRLAQGDGVFFESRMLHEVTPITRGQRFDAERCVRRSASRSFRFPAGRPGPLTPGRVNRLGHNPSAEASGLAVTPPPSPGSCGPNPG